MIGIESKFVAIDDKTVVEQRRIVTPWFYIKLKCNSYGKVETYVHLIYLSFKFKGWQKNNKYLLFESSDSKTITLITEAVQKIKPSNVVPFKKAATERPFPAV